MENNEVIHVEAEEVSIKTEIADTLVKSNITESLISSLYEKYGNLDIVDINDRAGYEAVKAGRKECKQWRVMAFKICKEGAAPYQKMADAWLDTRKDVCGRIGGLEDKLEEKEKYYEAEQERLRIERKGREDRQWLNRSMELGQMGAVLNDGEMQLREVGFEASLIRSCDEETYHASILPKYRAIYEQINAERMEVERLAAEQKAAEERKRRELEEQQQAFQREKEAFELKRYETRTKDLRDLGLGLNNVTQNWEGFGQQLRNEYVKEAADQGWQTNIEILKEAIVTAKARIAAQQEQQQKEREATIQARIEAEKKQAAEDAIRREEARKEQERRQREEELAKAMDKEKWADVMSYLGNTPIHEMRSSQYRTKMKIVKDFLADLKSK